MEYRDKYLLNLIENMGKIPEAYPTPNHIEIIVPGQSEQVVLPRLLENHIQTTIRTKYTKTISYNKNNEICISPKVMKHVEASFRVNPIKIILLFDREDAEIYPDQYELKVRKRIIKELGHHSFEWNKFSVICVNHCFENWLLADLNVFKSKLFVRNLSNQVKSKSDCNPAQKIIKESMDIKFIKVKHSLELSRFIDLSKPDIRKRSPSLDKFLRILEL